MSPLMTLHLSIVLLISLLNIKIYVPPLFIVKTCFQSFQLPKFTILNKNKITCKL